MPSILVDTGPLVALFDRTEQQHRQVVQYFSQIKQELISTWVILTEVSYLLSFNLAAQLDFLRWVTRGGIKLIELPEDALEQATRLMEKYRDHPMDLADATLIVLSMQTGIRDIITFDTDFDFYRLPDRTKLKNLLAKKRTT